MSKNCSNFYLTCMIICIVFQFSNCATIPNEERIDNIPMYGQPDIQRPEHMKKADEVFIKKASSGFKGGRKEASKVWAAVAEDFFKKGNIHYAMRRYNQSWLLDPSNYLPYWGFGQVMVARKKYDDAIVYFEKSKELIDDPYQKVALLVDTGIAYSFKAESVKTDQPKESASYFGIANLHFEESTTLDASYAESWRRWAYSLYRQGKYAEAWVKVAKARSLRGRPFPEAFLRDLRDKMPDPN